MALIPMEKRDADIDGIFARVSHIFHINAISGTIPVTSGYISMLTVVFIQGIGSCVMVVYVAGNNISKILVAGLQGVVDALTITKGSSGYTFSSTNGQKVEATIICSNLS